MINVKDQKTREAIEGFHEAMLRKAKRGSKVKEDIVTENHIFAAICNNFDMEPSECAVEANAKYGCCLTKDDVIQVLRHVRMANPVERKEIFEWCSELTGYFEKAVAGDRASFDKYEKRRKEPALKNGKKHDSQDRVAAIMIYEKHPEIDLFDDTDSLHLLGNTLARYFFYDMADAIGAAYNFPQYRDTKKKAQNAKTGNKMTYEQAERKINQLENALERTNTMLQDLQDEFEEQLQASKVKELADFFAKLNSEKYGCILDELLVVRRGVDQLRKDGFELPIEINGLLIMVKKLVQFVRDSHIEPIMKINSVREVTASDLEFCNYEGTPFSTPDEKKKVKVVSPGWIYKDKEVQISRPKVKEED